MALLFFPILDRGCGSEKKIIDCFKVKNNENNYVNISVLNKRNLLLPLFSFYTVFSIVLFFIAFINVSMQLVAAHQ